MALSEFRNTQSWQGAIELGPWLVRLAEELPAAEQVGLSMQLRQSMVDLPTAIATDLLESGSNTRKPATLRLVAMLDLIEKIYPALDTAEVRAAVQQLADQLSSDSFGEQTAGAAAAYLPGAASAASTPAAPPAPVTPAPAPADVPVVEIQPPATAAPSNEVAVDADGSIGAPATSEPAAAPVSTTVPVLATPTPEDSNVHPDSVQ